MVKQLKFYYKIIAIIFILISIFNCSKDFSPIGNDNTELYHTYYKSPDGLLMKLDSLQDTYSLDDEIKAEFTVSNISDSLSIHIISSSGPLGRFYMHDLGGQRINFYPRYKTGTYYDFYFNPGDSKRAILNWNQTTYSNDHFSDLKAYAGKYLITLSYAGISTNKMGKWITIDEIGDPFSAKLYYYFSDKDTLRLEFIIRNRISNDIILEPENDTPLVVNYVDDSSRGSMLTHYPKLDFEKTRIKAKSSEMLYCYKISRQDPLLGNLRGSYICVMDFNFKSRSIRAWSYILL